MHLVSRETQVVNVGDEFIPFDKGESIWTESSYKYDLERLEQLAAAAGFRIDRLWIDHSASSGWGFSARSRTAQRLPSVGAVDCTSCTPTFS